MNTSKDIENKNIIQSHNVLNRTLQAFKEMEFNDAKINKLVDELLNNDEVELKEYDDTNNTNKPKSFNSSALKDIAKKNIASPTREYVVNVNGEEFIINLKMELKKEDIVTFLSKVFLFTANMEIIKSELDKVMKEHYGTELTIEMYFILFLNQLTFTTLSSTDIEQNNPVTMVMEGFVMENTPVKQTLKKVFGECTIEALNLLGVNCMAVTAEILLENTNATIETMKSDEYKEKLKYYASEQYKKDIKEEDEQ